MIHYFALALFIISSVLNLLGTRKGFEKLFNPTKPLILLFAVLYVISRTYPAIDIWLVTALAACWLGDILLIPAGNGWFIAGGLSFFAGHVLLIIRFAGETDLKDISLPVIISAAVIYICASLFIIIRSKKDIPTGMILPVAMYLICNAAMNLFALVRLTQDPCVWAILSFIGAVLFFLSDCCLFLQRYDKEKASFFKSDFFVMLTYISGIALITLGLVPL